MLTVEACRRRGIPLDRMVALGQGPGQIAVVQAAFGERPVWDVRAEHACPHVQRVSRRRRGGVVRDEGGGGRERDRAYCSDLPQKSLHVLGTSMTGLRSAPARNKVCTRPRPPRLREGRPYQGCRTSWPLWDGWPSPLTGC